MLVVLLLLSSTLAQEASESLGKKSVQKHRENIYSLAFLSVFWSVVILAVTLLFGAGFKLSMDSLPTLLPRIGLEILLAFIGAEALIKADRSTVGFLRILTIPLLLIVDLSLGYAFSQMQIIGVILMFFALGLAFHHSPKGKRGAWLVILGALISVATASLYKYDITHFNSVVAEQLIVLTSVAIFFYFASGRSPFRLLFKPVTGAQAASSGAGMAIESFAYSFAPASVIIALKRTFALMWGILFGKTYFHEKSFSRKMFSGAIMILGLFMLVAPYASSALAG